jgi:hypothetical protein
VLASAPISRRVGNPSQAEDLPHKRGAKRILGPGIVALVFLYVAGLTLSGRKAFVPSVDLLQDTANAQRFLQKGWIPTHGSVSSFNSFNPPGVSWALMPGLLVFPSEPALAEALGSLLMVALTLVGLYLLLAGRFGPLAAVLVCILFMLSDRGLFFSRSLWPRAHPLFLVWFVYSVYQWLEGRRYALACALTIWFAGAYWMMEGITALLILPLAWMVYRPAVRWREVSLALAAGLLIWSPYLNFEASRNFVDLQSLLRRVNTRADLDADLRRGLTNQNLKLVENDRPHGTTDAAKEAFHWIYDQRQGWVYQAVDESVAKGVHGRWTYAQGLGGWVFLGPDAKQATILQKGGRIWRSFFASMPETRIPGGAGFLLFVFVSSVAWGLSGSMPGWRKWVSGRWAGLPNALSWGFAVLFGVAMVAVSVILRAM